MSISEKMLESLLDYYNTPTTCSVCSGVMIYKGVGEYRCEDCDALEYDDYGKVRNYLERHPGANIGEISSYTRVSHRVIREMVKEKRFEIIDNRGGYLRCEMCGVNINIGRLCSNCEMIYHKKLEEEVRNSRKKEMTGYGEALHGEKGSKRYTRER